MDLLRSCSRSVTGDLRGECGATMLTGVGMLEFEFVEGVRSWIRIWVG